MFMYMLLVQLYVHEPPYHSPTPHTKYKFKHARPAAWRHIHSPTLTLLLFTNSKQKKNELKLILVAEVEKRQT